MSGARRRPAPTMGKGAWRKRWCWCVRAWVWAVLLRFSPPPPPLVSSWWSSDWLPPVPWSPPARLRIRTHGLKHLPPSLGNSPVFLLLCTWVVREWVVKCSLLFYFLGRVCVPLFWVGSSTHRPICFCNPLNLLHSWCSWDNTELKWACLYNFESHLIWLWLF